MEYFILKNTFNLINIESNSIFIRTIFFTFEFLAISYFTAPRNSHEHIKKSLSASH